MTHKVAHVKYTITDRRRRVTAKLQARLHTGTGRAGARTFTIPTNLCAVNDRLTVSRHRAFNLRHMELVGLLKYIGNIMYATTILVINASMRITARVDDGTKVSDRISSVVTRTSEF